MTFSNPFQRAAYADSDMFEPLSALLEAWTEGIEEGISDTNGVMAVTRIGIDIPFEMQLVEGEAELRLHGSAPTQHTETTVLPVWHRLRATFAVANDEWS